MGMGEMFPQPSINDDMQPSSSAVVVASELYYFFSALTAPPQPFIAEATCSLVVMCSSKKMKTFCIQVADRVFPVTSEMLLQTTASGRGVGGCTGNSHDGEEESIVLSLKCHREQLRLCFSASMHLLLVQWQEALGNALACLLVQDACHVRAYKYVMVTQHILLPVMMMLYQESPGRHVYLHGHAGACYWQSASLLRAW